MNKKIASELAIGVVLLVAFVIAGISWFSSMRVGNEVGENLSQVQQPIRKQTRVMQEEKKTEECKPRYYEGNDKVNAWYISEDGDSVVMAISKESAVKLPGEMSKNIAEQEEITIKLIDATDEVKKSAKASTKKNPTEITVQGYAEVCQQPPLVSLEKATIAFKGRS